MILTHVPILVANVVELLDLGFTHVEVWNSEDAGGNWAEITAARTALATNRVDYTFTDLDGSDSDSRYKYRFSANGEAPFSGWSKNVKPVPAATDPAKISLGYATFIDIAGAPTKATIIVANEGAMVNGSVVYGPRPMVYEADEQGYVQIPLLRGAKVVVAIEGTGVVRTITVPNTQIFDLMGALAEAPDMFTVQTTPPLLTRRTP